MQMIAAALVAIAALYLAGCMVVLGRKTSGYSHIRHTISELGEIGAPHQRTVAFGVFVPVGILLLGATGLLYRTAHLPAAFALCLAVGYIVAALFPCDPGSPLSGSARQGLHNLGGAVEYIGSGLVLLALSETQGVGFRHLAWGIFGATGLLSVLPSSSVRGLVQRLAELGLFGGLVIAALATYRGA